MCLLVARTVRRGCVEVDDRLTFDALEGADVAGGRRRCVGDVGRKPTCDARSICKVAREGSLILALMSHRGNDGGIPHVQRRWSDSTSGGDGIVGGSGDRLGSVAHTEGRSMKGKLESIPVCTTATDGVRVERRIIDSGRKERRWRRWMGNCNAGPQ
jgi:hypothetical protein